MARYTWEQAQQMIAEMADNIGRYWPRHNLHESITRLLRTLRIPFRNTDVESFIQGLYERVYEAAFESVHQDSDSAEMDDEEVQEAVSMLEEDPWFASDVVREFINDEFNFKFRVEDEMDFRVDPTWEEAQDHVWQSIRRVAHGYPIHYANTLEGEGRVDEIHNAMEDMGIIVPRDTVAWLMNRVEQEGHFQQPGVGTEQSSQTFSSYLNEILREEHGIFDEDSYRQRRKLDSPKPPQNKSFPQRTKAMQHNTKMTPDEMQDTLAFLWYELYKNPQDDELRGVFADALDDAGEHDLANYHRHLIGRPRHFLHEPEQSGEVRQWLEELGEDIWNHRNDQAYIEKEIKDLLDNYQVQYDPAELSQLVDTLSSQLQNIPEEEYDEYDDGPRIEDEIADEINDSFNVLDRVDELHEEWREFNQQRVQEGGRPYRDIRDAEHKVRQTSESFRRRNFPPKEDTPELPQEPETPEEPPQGEKSMGPSWEEFNAQGDLDDLILMLTQEWNNPDSLVNILESFLQIHDIPHTRSQVQTYVTQIKDVVMDVADMQAPDEDSANRLLADPEWIQLALTDEIGDMGQFQERFNLPDTFDSHNQRYLQAVEDRQQTPDEDSDRQRLMERHRADTTARRYNSKSVHDYKKKAKEVTPEDDKSLRSKYHGKSWPFVS